jgi:hypothetical protein
VTDPDLEAYLAAERLVREAHARAQEAAGDAGPAPPRPPLAELWSLVDAARGTLPPDLARQLADALRQLLIALRAVLDYSIARLEPPPPEDSPPVEDIPIG